jgi:hypothetical protein
VNRSNDCELISPYIKRILGIEDGILVGKDKLEHFWKIGIEKVPDLHLELLEIAESVDTLAIYYKSINHRKAIEIMFFNSMREINKVFVHYS